MTTYEIISTVFLLVAAIYAGRQVSLMKKSNKAIHEWNRKISTLEILKDFSRGDFPRLKEELHDMSGIWIDEDTNYNMVKEVLEEQQLYGYEVKLRQLINIFEGIAIAIKNNIVDEDICYDYAAVIFKRYYKWTKPFIDKRRNISKDPTVYIDFEEKANSWIERLEAENERIKQSDISKGKE